MSNSPLTHALPRLEPGTARQSQPRKDFHEAPIAKVRRWALGIAYAWHPKRISSVPPLLALMARDAIRGGTRLPTPDKVSAIPDSFAGICRDLSTETIVSAARGGFYPWCHVGPLKWWTRQNRMVLFFEDHHIAKRFRTTMRTSGYRVTFDTAFDAVVKACAEPRSNRSHALTWITPRIMQLYSDMHRAGYAHSVEVWDKDGNLAGGSYGVAVGRVFVTESQFFRQPNASKIGYHVLNHHLEKWGFVLNDNKGWTEATAKMGFKEIPRARFEEILAAHANGPDKLAPWVIEDDVAAVAAATGTAPLKS